MQSRSATHAKGVDVSHWQGIIDWKKVKAAGYSFAFIKASEGPKIVDDRFKANVQGAKAAGVLVGAYHFTRAAKPEDVRAELDHFLQMVDTGGGFDSLKLPCVLDMETKEGGSRSNISAIIREWSTQFKQRTGRNLMLYTFPNFIDTSLDKSLGDIPLWYAYYSSSVPPNKGGWTSWEFMQYTDKGKVAGISGNVDLNEYKGSEAELMAAANGSNSNPEGQAPAWKEGGRQWLIDHAGISKDWKAQDPIDIGTLGTILAKYVDKSSDKN
ncbi:glycoside hydrolase family 25 protein [Paenibacillus pini]|uniref:Phage lysin n=1 Tax=Paenibacillus pini JCM 16418 TaxID=1236976 RepID=W7YWI1_9BACL|nr:glycoside hydrolase family 25 protein [Paenibacillus pini]GAF06694.1 phage lysin [Paenibacillus pini JCM 16418]